MRSSHESHATQISRIDLRQSGSNVRAPRPCVVYPHLARYTVIPEREADGGYVAKGPAWLGCVSQGDSREKAMANIREAAELWIEDCAAADGPHGK